MLKCQLVSSDHCNEPVKTTQSAAALRNRFQLAQSSGSVMWKSTTFTVQIAVSVHVTRQGGSGVVQRPRAGVHARKFTVANTFACVKFAACCCSGFFFT
jgi:hypothetical protein